MARVFAFALQPKVVELGSDQRLHRAQKEEELRREVEALAAAGKAPAEQSLFQPGGGCFIAASASAAPSGDASIATSVASVGTALCIFTGRLSNAATLEGLHMPLPEDEPSPAGSSLSDAELLCHMYGKVGVEMLGLLRGTFTFALYESKTSRVLASRDGTGHHPLFEARSGAGSLIICSSRELLEAAGCTGIVEFQPGDYKYGWGAAPRRYVPAENARLARRSLDMPSSPAASRHAHAHLPQSGGGRRSGSGAPDATPPSSKPGSRRCSLDVHDAPAGGADGGARSRRTSMDQGHAGGGNAGAGGAPGGQGGQGGHAQHGGYRTYVISAEEPRIHKIKAAAAAPGAPAAASAPGAAAGGSGAKDAAGPEAKDAKGGAPRERVRRSSMDAQGAWRLGSGPPQAAKHAAAESPAGKAQQQQQHQHQQGGGGGGRRRGGGGSKDGRTEARPASAQAEGGAEAPARAVAAAAAAAAASLRADAPEWRPPAHLVPTPPAPVAAPN